MNKLLIIPILLLFASGCIQTREQAMGMKKEEDTTELQKSILALSRRVDDLNQSVTELKADKGPAAPAAKTEVQEATEPEKSELPEAVQDKPIQLPTPVEPLAVDIMEEPEEKEEPIEVAKKAPLSMKEHYNMAMALYKKGDYKEAIAAFDSFLASYPATDYSDNALYWKGESYYSQAKYLEAITFFEEVIARFPEGNKAPDAQLKTGYAYVELKNKTKAKASLQKVMDLYPFSEAAKRATEKLNSL